MQTKKNLYTYLAVIMIALVGIIYGNSLFPHYHNLRIWTYIDILILLAGVPFLFLQSKSGLPNFWEPSVTNKNRFLMPVLVGLVFGILDVLVYQILLHPEPYTSLPPFLQPFPYSIFLYFSGAFEVEVFYRLIPLTLICWIGSVVKKGKYANYFFWTAAVLTALREPLEQMPDAGALLLAYSLVTGFLMNFLQAIYYRSAGFLSSLFLRLGHYLIWHILLGIYVQFVELSI